MYAHRKRIYQETEVIKMATIKPQYKPWIVLYATLLCIANIGISILLTTYFDTTVVIGASAMEWSFTYGIFAIIVYDTLHPYIEPHVLKCPHCKTQLKFDIQREDT
jgi:hypothetical protein